MEYLKNNICNFEILFSLNTEKKKNIISTCFFKMDKHYKKFDIYIEGMKNLIKILEKQNKYILRIFIDENIKNDKEIFTVLNSSEKVEIVIFKCINYMNNNFHIDVFGSLVRFFPLFDFPNNDSKNVIIIDIDLNENDRFSLEQLINFNCDDKEIICAGQTSKMIMEKVLPHLLAGLIGFFNCRFNNSIITNFIENAHNIKDTGKYERRLSTFGYGVDELFLNKYFIYYNDSIHIKDIKIGSIIDYNINWFFYYYKDILKKNTDIYDNLKYILGDLYNENYSLDDMFNNIDNYIYHNRKYYNEKIYLSKRYYELLNILEKNNKHIYEDKYIQELLKNFTDIVNSISVIYFTPTNPPIITEVSHLRKYIVKYNNNSRITNRIYIKQHSKKHHKKHSRKYSKKYSKKYNKKHIKKHSKNHSKKHKKKHN